uniref:PEAK family member 3 n=2 Tax=Latimeria chalumnae TaxID=7897 RepID=H3AH29_LATCH
QASIPPHFNVQQICLHFTDVVLVTPSSSQELVFEAETAESSKKVESPSTSSNSHGNNQAETGCKEVVIVREVPYQTLAEFVKENKNLHEIHPSVYERHMCLLLLQLCMGLEHLKKHKVTHCDLQPENLLLVKCMSHEQDDQKAQDMSKKPDLPRLLISNFSKAKQMTVSQVPDNSADHARLAPELFSASQYKKVDEFQVGILIYELLHQPNPFEKPSELKYKDYSLEDLPVIPNQSVYSPGLQCLAKLLLHADPRARKDISQAKNALELILWGPRKELFIENSIDLCLIQNWLEIKRALLTLKLGEKLFEDKGIVDLEHWFCCQYFTISKESILRTAQILQIL